MKIAELGRRAFPRPTSGSFPPPLGHFRDASRRCPARVRGSLRVLVIPFLLGRRREMHGWAVELGAAPPSQAAPSRAVFEQVELCDTSARARRV